MNQTNAKLVIIKYYYRFIIKEIRGFEWQVSLLFFVMNYKKLSLHVAQISQQNYSKNHKTRFYDQISKTNLELGSQKGDKKMNPIPNLLVCRIRY